MIHNQEFKELLQKAKIRLLQMHYESGVGHIGGNLSALDSLLYLHHSVMDKNDIFILSKGHSAGALYVTLWSIGLLSDDDLKQFHKDGTKMAGHPVPGWHPQISIATGSLGHGFPIAAGIALAKKLENKPGRVYCLTSDGEWQEGTNWEALIFAHHNGLDNLTVLVDENGLQGFGTTQEVASMADLRSRIESFGGIVCEIDGHSEDALAIALKEKKADFQVVILKTIKGNAVSFMENRLSSHYLPLTGELYQQAIGEINRK